MIGSAKPVVEGALLVQKMKTFEHSIPTFSIVLWFAPVEWILGSWFRKNGNGKAPK